MVFNYLKGLKDRQVALHYPLDHLQRWGRQQLEKTAGPTYRILDIGLGSGRDLKALREFCPEFTLELHGVETREIWTKKAEADGITAHQLDIERDSLPFPEEFFDIVLSNQVIEHTKELFWIFSEIARVLKKSGLAIIGCPNLGSWHNRVALVFGRQPPCMRLLGPHVRGITKPGFRELIERGGYFQMIGYHGANFYPFGGGVNRTMAWLFPSLTATHYFILRRTAKRGSFLEVLDLEAMLLFDTPYYRGREVSRPAVPDSASTSEASALRHGPTG
jgi:SAM-dependent methyltransferase